MPETQTNYAEYCLHVKSVITQTAEEYGVDPQKMIDLWHEKMGDDLSGCGPENMGSGVE